jgi:hypothetical protein
MALNVGRLRRGCRILSVLSLAGAGAVLTGHFAFPVAITDQEQLLGASLSLPPAAVDDNGMIRLAIERLSARSLRASLTPPSPPPPIALPIYRLTGTVVDGDRSLAFITFPDTKVHVFAIGDLIQNVELIAVQRRQVTLRIGEQRLDLAMEATSP